ncbi:MAG: hypothetical protein ACREAA_09985 [Candidatus Polarisedimenticolia bacterium]
MFRHGVIIGIGCALMGAPAGAALQPRHVESLGERVMAPYAFVATSVPQDLSEVQEELDGALLSQVSEFLAEAGPDWSFWVDRRSGGMARVEGSGVRWLSTAGGAASLEELEARARAFMNRYPAFFNVPSSQLELEPAGSRQFGESGQFWQIAFRQVIDGLPVDSARVILRLSHGNLVQFGVDRVLPPAVVPKTAAATLSALQARASLSNYIGGLQKDDVVGEDVFLLWVPRGVEETGVYAGPIGYGWEAALVYRLSVKRDGELGEWQALVDARTGDVVRFVDSNDYAKVVLRGSVYTLANCTDAMNCVPGSASELAATMPGARMNFVGGACTGDGCYTNESGAFEYPAGATAASTSLDGKYFTIVDSCGPLAGAAASPGGIDLGTSDPNPPLDTNTDCMPATRESPPGTGPTSGGTGDTHSARNTFHHLNLINQKSRGYLPHNEWLKGEDGSIGNMQVNVNAPPACNALWTGNDTGFVFMRVTPGTGCNNTGEIPDVFLHEYGHGLDDNDATGSAPESGTGEAMGDTFALLQGQHSCIGTGLFLPNGTIWGNTSGYGSSSRLCSGVRELDYTRFCTHGTLEGCTSPPDPDMVNGSHAGVSPNLLSPDAGTPARWNHMLTGFAGGGNGKSNFYNCGGPESVTGCAGALNHGCHCESLIGSQANWDLAKRLIHGDFGGFIYRTPQGPTEVSGWQYMDRLWYLTRDLSTSSYTATGPFPDGTTNGCGINNWFSTYRFIDDDNGSLADGTPHAADIFAAFDLHAIACGTAAEPSNQSSGCPALVAAPALSACGSQSPVQLDWTASAGAAQYRILRNTLGCEYGFTPVATVDGAQSYFEDTEAATGFPYFYTVQPVSQNASCYGQASNCIAVVPTACGSVPLAAPGGVALTTPADNQVSVTWDPVPGAASYKILRKTGSCASAEPYQAIGVSQAPQTSFLDGIDLQGGMTYAYQVAASDAGCASCVSAPSVCHEVTVTGACAIEPVFAGLQSAVSGTDGSCHVTLNWLPGTPSCGSSLSYSVYRSTDPGFLPGPATLVASGLTGTTFADYGVAGGRHHYAVRATDAEGNIDDNLAKVSAIAVGTTTPGTFSDDAGDAVTASFTAAPTPGNTWAIRPAGGSPGRHYATTASGNYLPEQCMGLESPTIYLGSSSTLSFSTMYDMEVGWDGAYVDVSTEAGGFQNWTKLTTITYPGVMGGPQGSPACGGPGFEDGEPVFTGILPAFQTFSGSLSAWDGQAIRIRFLFSSDPSTAGAGWFIDNVSVTNALIPGQCVAEVSGAASADLLDVIRRPDGNLDFIFEDLGSGATAYNVYEGMLAAPFGAYTHAIGSCHNTDTTPGVPDPGRRTWSDYAAGSGNVYFLINAVSSTGEGILGLDSTQQVIPLPSPRCGPMP